MSQRHSVVGLGVALSSAAAFGTSGPFGKSLLLAGWSPGAVVTTRVGVAAVILLVPAVYALRGRWAALRRNVPLVVGYGLTGVAGCQLAYFYAVSHLSVGVALLLEYLAPVLIVGWLWARYRQVPGRLTMLGVGLALMGLLLVLDVTGGAKVNAIGVVWGLGAAVCLVLYFLLSAKVDDALPPVAFAGLGLVVGTGALGLAGLVGALDLTTGATRVTIGAATVSWWVPILVISVVAAAFAYVAGVASVRMLGAKVASFVALTEVLFAVVFAWLVLAELPTIVQLVGGVLIVGGLVAVRTDDVRSVAPGSSVPAPEPVPAGALEWTERHTARSAEPTIEPTIEGASAH